MIGRQINLAGNSHSPGECLVKAEENVGPDNPPPVGGKENQDRNGNASYPAEQQNPLAADAIGKPARHKVQGALDQTKGNHKGSQEEKGVAIHTKVLRHAGQHIAFHADDQTHKKDLNCLQQKLSTVTANASDVSACMVRRDVHAVPFLWRVTTVLSTAWLCAVICIWSRMSSRTISQTSKTLGLVRR